MQKGEDQETIESCGDAKDSVTTDTLLGAAPGFSGTSDKGIR